MKINYNIEKIDSLILAPVLEYLRSTKEDFKIMVLPDHPTPIRLRTHTIDPVPFMIYSSNKDRCGVETFTESSAAEKDYYVSRGHDLMNLLIQK